MKFKPGRIDRFTIDAAFQSDLDESDGENVPPEVRNAIENEIADAIEIPVGDTNYSLSSSATITVDKQGSQWTIQDDHVTYELVKTKEELLGFAQDFGDSMAEAIERGFGRAWEEVNGSQLPAEGRRDRRILFVAVAQGVIQYLKEHAKDGFDVGEGIQKESNQITSSGTVELPGVGEVDVTVTQDSNPENRVRSNIESTNGQIKLLINKNSIYDQNNTP